MKLTTVDSSAFYAVGYDAKSHTLDIVLYRTGIRRFVDVPAKVHKELLNSDSLGSHYALFLEGRFPERVLK